MVRFQCPKCLSHTLESVRMDFKSLECDSCGTVWVEFENYNVMITDTPTVIRT